MKKQLTTEGNKKQLKKLDKKLNKSKFNKPKMSKKKLRKKQLLLDQKINTKIELGIQKIIEELFTSLIIVFVFYSIVETVKFFAQLRVEDK